MLIEVSILRESLKDTEADIGSQRIRRLKAKEDLISSLNQMVKSKARSSLETKSRSSRSRD